MTIFKKVLGKIKRFFSDFDRKKKVAKVAMEVVNTLKHITERGETATLVKLTANQIDDAILEKLKDVLPGVAYSIAFAHKLIDQNANSTDALQAISEHIKSLFPEAGATFWGTMTAELIKAYEDGNISIAEGMILGQIAFLEYLEQKNKN